ncbi:MAG: calcium/sodium antiporter [Planctomycetaceae bacterium]
MLYIWMSVGLTALVLGAELLVQGAARLATAFGISSIVIGLTVVAFGTSAPELAVSVSSAIQGRADIAFGNVVGSNIFNVLFILGVSAMIVPLVVAQRLVQFDVPLMIGISILLLIFALDGSIGRYEGGMLFLGLIAYTLWCIRSGFQEPPEVQQEYAEMIGTQSPATPNAAKTFLVSKAGIIQNLTRIALGLLLLVVGARWFVEAASELARHFGVSELVIGLTIVAAGTSLPEVATSMIAAIRGERDIAVGNVVGSNLFNILGVLGITALLAPHGVAVATQAIHFDLPVMLACAAACLPVFFTGHTISRWEGAVFFGYSVAYTASLVMISTGSHSLTDFRRLMLGFVFPLTALTLVILGIREFKRTRKLPNDKDA